MGSEEKKKQKKKSGSNKRADRGENGGEAKMITDDRFSSAQSDPRFMEAPRKKSKVAIDSRFERVFTDTSFASSNARIDKRGKPNNKNNGKAGASLKHFYRLQEEDEEDNVKSTVKKEEEEKEEEIDNRADLNSSRTESDTESEEFDDSGKEEKEEEQSFDESSSTSTTDSDEEFVDSDEEDMFMLPQEENVAEIDKETHRLAIVNLDWGQVRAVDLYVLLSSFLPKGGQIISASVYPSEFGLKRIEEEAVRGPIGLFDDEDDENEHENDDDDDEIDNKKLRAYELSRLRYYFAVVKCDSIATSDYLYKTCDGVEFERSANKLDLRFIPDSMEFKQQPRDVATEAPADYEGLDFQTRALQHSNIHLTWDDDEPQRAKTLKRKLNAEQLSELEFKEFLASDESETDEDKVDDTEDISMKKLKKQDMYRALIQSTNGSDDEDEEDNEDQDMEVTFNSGLEDISKRILEKDKKSETVWEAYLRKRNEKKKGLKSKSKYSSEDNSSDTDQEVAEQQDDFFVEEPLDNTGNEENQVRKRKLGNSDREAEASRAELELLLADDKGNTDANLKGYNLKRMKKKGKKGKEVPDEGKIPTLDSDDPRFSALFTSPLFALDPTDPHFKRSATYTRQVAQKHKTSNHGNEGQKGHSPIPDRTSEMREEDRAKSDALPPRKEKHELSSLVKSIKMKLNQVRVPSKGKAPPKHRNLGRKEKKQK